MIKIEVTGASIGEVADKLLAIGSSLRKSDGVALIPATHPVNDTVSAPEDIAPAALQEVEVAEATPPEIIELGNEDTSSKEEVSSGPNNTTPPAGELNFDTDVAPYVLQVVKEKGKPVAQEILSQFGVEKASLLDPAQWPELVSLLKAQL